MAVIELIAINVGRFSINYIVSANNLVGFVNYEGLPVGGRHLEQSFSVFACEMDDVSHKLLHQSIYCCYALAITIQQTEKSSM